jgi:hypothetical protein
MSLSNKKILISGCGVSWSKQIKHTWVNLLKIVGANLIDVGGPAVSNQWVLNQAIDHLIHHSDVDHVIVQLTSLGKLDVEINDERLAELVVPDTIRNFIINGVWPSSTSQDHPAKQLWTKWLSSPGLELQDITNKLILLNHWCQTRGISLTVLQGYPLPWTSDQQSVLSAILDTSAESIISLYKNSQFYHWHDHSDQNTVPCIEYQFELAIMTAKKIDPLLLSRVKKMQDQYFSKYHAA